MKYLITGLGNIGSEYAHTRHNIGFDILDAFAGASGIFFSDGRYGHTGECKIKGRSLLLLKPNTYVNLSGNAVRYWLTRHKIPLGNLLVITDDLALPFGTLRLRPRGGPAGHNGLSHIIDVLGTNEFARLRFGIGSDFPKGYQVEHVLSTFSDEENLLLPTRIGTAHEIIRSFVLSGTEKTMSLYNNK